MFDFSVHLLSMDISNSKIKYTLEAFIKTPNNYSNSANMFYYIGIVCCSWNYYKNRQWNYSEPEKLVQGMDSCRIIQTHTNSFKHKSLSAKNQD